MMWVLKGQLFSSYFLQSLERTQLHAKLKLSAYYVRGSRCHQSIIFFVFFVDFLQPLPESLVSTKSTFETDGRLLIKIL